jgi:mRNA interferase HigB
LPVQPKGDCRRVLSALNVAKTLIAHLSFTFGRVLVKFIGTHAEYDRIDPETVSWRKK